jgi:hypothetical protein
LRAIAISRTRYRVVSDPAAADAVLEGAVLVYTSFPGFRSRHRMCQRAEVHALAAGFKERATGSLTVQLRNAQASNSLTLAPFSEELRARPRKRQTAPGGIVDFENF